MGWVRSLRGDPGVQEAIATSLTWVSHGVSHGGEDQSHKGQRQPHGDEEGDHAVRDERTRTRGRGHVRGGGDRDRDISM